MHETVVDRVYDCFASTSEVTIHKSENGFYADIHPASDLWIDSTARFLVSIPKAFPRERPVVVCTDISERIRTDPRLLTTVVDKPIEVERDINETGYISSSDEDFLEFKPLSRTISKIGASGEVHSNLFDSQYMGWLDSYKIETVVYTLRILFLKSEEELRPSPGWYMRQSGHFSVCIESSVHEEQGPRDTMEDQVCAVDELYIPFRVDTDVKDKDVSGFDNSQHSFGKDDEKETRVSLHGVFDGHGGDVAAKEVSSKLESIFFSKLFDNSSLGIKRALYDAVYGAEQHLMKVQPLLRDDSGTTACVVALDMDQGVLYCANAGDSRAILCRGGTAMALSEDHKADRPDEVARVVDTGGFVSYGRVLRVLAVGRALGDPDMKVPPNKFVSFIPDIRIVELHPEDEFIVVACDGLFDVMSNQEIIEFIKIRVVKEMDLLLICQKLVRHALENRNSQDNVSVIIIRLVPLTLEEEISESSEFSNSKPISADDFIQGTDAANGPVAIHVLSPSVQAAVQASRLRRGNSSATIQVPRDI